MRNPCFGVSPYFSESPPPAPSKKIWNRQLCLCLSPGALDVCLPAITTWVSVRDIKLCLNKTLEKHALWKTISSLKPETTGQPPQGRRHQYSSRPAEPVWVCTMQTARDSGSVTDVLGCAVASSVFTLLPASATDPEHCNRPLFSNLPRPYHVTPSPLIQSLQQLQVLNLKSCGQPTWLQKEIC